MLQKFRRPFMNTPSVDNQSYLHSHTGRIFPSSLTRNHCNGLENMPIIPSLTDCFHTEQQAGRGLHTTQESFMLRRLSLLAMCDDYVKKKSLVTSWLVKKKTIKKHYLQHCLFYQNLKLHLPKFA